MEVIKEVVVPGETVVVEREVVKEVPVEVVVEREVAREVEKVVEVEADYGGSSPASTGKRSEYRPAELSAGEVDDNERWEEYLQYRDSYTGPGVHDVDVSERYVISVRDSLDRPVPNAAVKVSVDDETIFEGRTYANGQSLFFPLAFPQTGDASVFSLYVEKDGVGRHLEATRHEESEWVVTLDMERDDQQNVPLDILFPARLYGQHGRRDRPGEEHAPLRIGADTQPAVGARPSFRDGHLQGQGRRIRHPHLRLRPRRAAVPAYDPGSARRWRGRYPESVNEALHEAVHGPSWRHGDAIRLVFLIADAPPHLDYEQDKDYAEEMIEAHRRGIKVFTIASSGLDDQGEYVFRQISQHTMGRFIFIVYGSDGLTPHHVSEYTVQNLDDLVVRLVEEELSHLVGDGQDQVSLKR